MKVLANMVKSFRYVRTAFLYTKVEAIKLIVLKIICGIIPTIQIFLIASIVDNMKVVTNIHKSRFVTSLIAFGFSIAFMWISNQLYNLVMIKMAYKLKEKFRTDLVKRVAELDYYYIENEESMNLITRVIKSPENEISDGYGLVINLFELVLRMSGILLTLSKFSIKYAIGILLLNLPIIYLSKKNGEVTYKASQETTILERKFDYYNNILLCKDSATERNVFRYSKWLQNKWINVFDEMKTKVLSAFLKYFWKIRFYGIISSVLSISMLIILVDPLVKHSISYGMYLGFASNIFSFETIFTQQLTQYVKGLAQKIEYMSDLQRFQSLNTIQDSLSIPSVDKVEIDKVEFRNVSFKYPDTDIYVIKNLNLTLQKGKQYAFVGVNGAGKTTIVKLLSRLYDSYEGEILINNKEIREYSFSDIKSIFSIINQDYAKYNVSIYDNIMLGDINSLLNNEQPPRYKDLINKADLSKFISSLPLNDKTILGKLGENDVELSTGQWQKVAMLRAMINDDISIRILDEPTASLDPISEKKLYEEYSDHCKGILSIFISHRLGAVHMVDEIVVFNEGRVFEQGDFDTLIANRGLFYEMYEKQRSWYNEKI